jgi:hypothetical protein
LTLSSNDTIVKRKFKTCETSKKILLEKRPTFPNGQKIKFRKNMPKHHRYNLQNFWTTNEANQKLTRFVGERMEKLEKPNSMLFLGDSISHRCPMKKP